jgi:hypothetical protein
VLSSADIRVAFAGAEAVVDAEYTVVGASDIDFVALRIEGQGLVVEQAAMGFHPIALEERRTAVLLRVYRPFDSATVRIRYRLTGRLTRIPLFVPSAPTRPPSRAIGITVAGPSEDDVTATTLPRFRRETDGSLVAHPEHVPTVLAVVADGAGVPIPLFAEWFVVTVALVATGYWLLRLARRAGRAAPAGH